MTQIIIYNTSMCNKIFPYVTEVCEFFLLATLIDGPSIVELLRLWQADNSGDVQSAVSAIFSNIWGGGAKCRGNEGVRMSLLSGTDIIYLVNYIINMWLKHSRFHSIGNVCSYFNKMMRSRPF